MVFDQFAGVFAPIPTPFSEKDLTINFEYIRRHLEFLQEKGVNGALVLGTNSEFPSLSIEERKNIISWVMKFRGDLKVMVQVGTSSFVETIGLSHYAMEKGADALLICAPFYFKEINEIGLIDYYFQIFNRVQHPIFLYHMPQVTQVPITEKVIESLLSFSNFLGLKESSGQWDTTKHYIEKFRQLHIFTGNDLLFRDALDIGAGGCITAVCNSLPELPVSLFHAVRVGEDVSYIQSRLSAYRKLLQQFPLQSATKYILQMRNFPAAGVRPPLTELTESQKRGLERGLVELGFDFPTD
ncbi:MAG: dihydrodipicolinate synthase family protein [Calditrichaeota bacterium]|nr:dihydrodipicolinate synthase family protein [Calditrichota bacterium]